MFNFFKRFAGDNFLPLTDMGSPFLNPKLKNDGLFGAFSGEIVLWKINSGAGFFGFSKTLPSVEVWYRLSSIEKGGAPFLSLGILISFF